MKNKILTFSFDDDEIYDRQLCEMFRKYGIKGTFFVISNELSLVCPHHRYGEDTIVYRVTPQEIKDTYAGMEVASHTSNHNCPINDLENAVVKSFDYLSELCGYRVRGMAYPGGVYSPELIAELKKLGIVEYSRTIKETHGFSLPEDWLEWHPTCHYADDNILALADEFLAYDGDEPILFNIYGHSYELTQKQEGKDWSSFEKLLKKLAGRDDVWYASYIEIYDEFKQK